MRIAGSRDQEGPARAKFIIYQVQFAGHAIKELTLRTYVLTLVVEDDLMINTFTTAENLFYCGYGDYLQLWNFVNDTYARGHIPDKEHEDILITNEHVVIITKKSISLESIPRDNAPGKPPWLLEPSFVISLIFGEENPHLELYSERLQDWYNSSHMLTMLDVVFGDPEREEYTISTFAVTLPTSNSPGSIVLRDSKERTGQNVKDCAAADTSACNGYILKGRREDPSIYNNSLVPANCAATGLHDLYVAVPMDESSYLENGIEKNAFDPTSRRLCFGKDEETLFWTT
ncbi:unnamed protein product [Cyclocybe aegerita]|uniref:Uncharacterized protein n=1 Tax=Cyclocybe aegerita TaxID=1973307 RepID=A0A8S0WMU9_CYCAE|nr:unnamed protein product [Cyclocybe aegerita]